MSLKSKLENLSRFQHIITVLVKHGFSPWFSDLGWTKRKAGESVEHESIPRRLRLAFEELGPTFIKLGQLLSTRPDLLPESATQEFAKLTDQIAPFAFSEVLEILKSEFEEDPFSVFSSIDETAMAAASIAQVHRAVLKESGKRVVLKIQRPDMERTIQSDIQILYFIARALEKVHRDFKLFNLTAIVQEFQRTIYEELDFTLEAKNIDLFRENMPDPDGIVLPEVYWSWTSRRVLTMSEIPGKTLSQIDQFPAHINRSALAEKLVTFFFESMLLHGLFHADAHSGNVLLIDEGEGKIGLLDFGMVGTLGPRMRQKLSQLFLAIISQDFESLALIYTDVGEFKQHISLRDFQGDVERLLAPHFKRPLKEIEIGTLLLQSTQIARKYGIRLPRDMIMLYRSLITLDHLGRKLDPDFDVIAVGKRFAENLMRRRFSKDMLIQDFLKLVDGVRTLGIDLPVQVRALMRNFERQQSEGAESHERLIQQLIRSQRSMLHAMVAVSLLAASLVSHFKGLGGWLEGGLWSLTAFSWLLFWLLFWWKGR